MDLAGVGGIKWMSEMPKEEKLDEELKAVLAIKEHIDRALTITGYMMRTQAFYNVNK